MRKIDAQLNNPYAVKYWPTWIGIGFIYLISYLIPFKAQMALGKFIGELFYRRNGSRVVIARRNIELCFPDKTKEEREQLVRRNMWHTGCWLIDTNRGLSRNNRPFADKLLKVEGLEYFDEGLAKGNGVLLLGAHFLCIDMAGSLFAAHRELDIVYATQPNALYNDFIRKGRLKSHPRVIERRDTRSLIRAFRDGHAVWFSPDQDFGAKHSLFAPFFGVEAATVTTTTKIARMTGCAIVPLAFYRSENFDGYTVRMFPPIENIPGESEMDDILVVNKIVEEMIMVSPENYLWAHKRFKSRPDGTKNTLYKNL